MIRLPDQATTQIFQQACGAALRKKPKLRAIERVRFDQLHEAEAVQMLHVGPYSTDPVTMSAIHSYVKNNNLAQCGLHHEIYLSDPRKVKPEIMKTLLRLPVTNL